MSWMQQTSPLQQQQPQVLPHPTGQAPIGGHSGKSPGAPYMPNSMRTQSNESVTTFNPSQQHPQGLINNVQHQQVHGWQQQQNALNHNNVMTPTSSLNWQQQQNVTNANMPPQQYSNALPATDTVPTNWPQVPVPQQPQQPVQMPGQFVNFYAQTSPQPPQVQQQQQPQQPQQYYQHDNASYLQQSQPLQQLPQPPQQQQQQQLQQNSNTTEFYNHGTNQKAEGWGDWDWNDNTTTSSNSEPQNSSQHSHTQHSVSSNIIEDSFNSRDNDNWHWNVPDERKEISLGENSMVPPSGTSVNSSTNSMFQSEQTKNSQVPQQVKAGDVSVTTTKKNENFTANNLNETVGVKPTTLPLPNINNQNFNSNDPSVPASVSTSHNIPSSVYVSQAKPVSRPSRQYASPPGGSTPSEIADSMISPPQGFQNELPKTESPPVNRAQAAGPPPTTSPPLLAGPAGGVNPFKRSGMAQHHRAEFLPSTTTTSTMPPLPSTSAFNVAPPPPADFANIMPAPHANTSSAEPDNLEILHENQEVIGITSLPTVPQNITLPGGTSTLHPTPQLNEERNQYLQTGHLSENIGEELNAESDSLPPPGLSRLVLGEPELADTQRMVTGTEQPSSIVTNLTLEERHADGEDTSTEPLIANPMINITQRSMLSSSTGSPGAGSASSSNNIDITTDRNLYLVTGESNIPNEQRVVTGVERVQPPIIGGPAQIMNEQREVMLDGENLDDQQIITVSSRNEPPLEGAASSAETTTTTPYAEPVEPHNSAKTKDLSNGSTGDDENDMDHHHHHGGGRYKVRKNPQVEKKAEKPRKERRHSVDRYESEEYPDEEYSSDRERERDRRRLYREGSVRSERGNEDRDQREKRRRDKHENIGDERDKLRDKYYYRDNGRPERRHHDGDSKYENDESARNELGRKEHSRRSGRNGPAEDRGGRSDRSDRDYDDYPRRHRGSKRDKAHGDRTHAERDHERELRDRERTRAGYVEPERRDRRHRRERNERDDADTLERRRRDRGDLRDYEEYRKVSSRNVRDSDTEKERARGADPRYDARHAAMYGGYPPYSYDPYTYYYEQMARTNPQAYAEWYKKYYGSTAAAAGTLGGHGTHSAGTAENITNSSIAATDGRESVHSGRSSTHNDRDRSGNISLRDVDASMPDPQRLTPFKYVNEHAVVSLSAGLLVMVKPKFTHHGTVSNIVRIQRLHINDATRQLFQAFPGPLVRGLTHKKTIIEFCEEQIRLGPSETTIYARQMLPNNNNINKYRASYALMWNLLILLLRQNGMVIGTDIAELLMKSQQQFPYQVNSNGYDSVSPTVSNSARNRLQSDNQSSGDSVDDELKSDTEKDREKETTSIDPNPAEPERVETIAKSLTLTEEEITEKFRNYLLYGNVNEALDWAADNNLWGHALFLASKMDRRSHANTMIKFANKLALNDPLQTLYQLMSGRTPSSVTSVQDEKWGDWRPHLSMILSNTSQKPELDRKAITTLGDSLFNRGDLFGAHFCYLMAQVSFGRYQESATQETTLQQNLPKLVLLGSSHYKPFHEFATNEAIMMTEIYEYACSLNNDKFSLVEFQPYKYLLATRLLDYGFTLKCLVYMEQIALHIERDPSKYEASFIQKIYELADRLKYYEPTLEKVSDEQKQGNIDESSGVALPNFEEQKWLQNLRSIAAQHTVDLNAHQVAGQQDNNINLENQIDKQFEEINAQFNQLNMQYASNTTDTSYYNADQKSQDTSGLSGNSGNYVLQQQQQQQQVHAEQPTTDYENPQQIADYAPIQEHPLPHTGMDAYGNYAQQGYIQSSVQQQQHQHQYEHQQQNAYYDPTQQQAAGADMTSGGYDYWAAQQQQQQHMQALAGDENARPTISMPKSRSYDSDDDGHKLSKQQTAKGGDAKKNLTQQQQRSKNDTKDAKGLQLGNQNSGWFGGIWSKLSLKPKNQMILPDDKNPTIVWDAEKKRWVNTDGDNIVEETLKPPPKLSDLMPQQQQLHQQPPQLQQQQLHQQPPQLQQQQQQPQSQLQPQLQSSTADMHQYGAGGGIAAVPALNSTLQTALPTPAASGHVGNVQAYSAAAAATIPTLGVDSASPKPPSLQSNMFKMQRNRTLKNSYVDVFNPSGAPMSKAADNVLAPVLPPATVPQGGFFIPGEANGGGASAMNTSYQAQQMPGHQQQQPEMPQFYNPNQFNGGNVGY